ncbi:hypothetical protein [Mesoterricola sediminis]|uniref:Lipoprotein n=1 Tax=Mesoterricola sediminis TaxID=2927980 RepID=A0AA48GUX6_9BACT|nr:hypothetical protein [Mesoterricola sediminis]BDU78249.1 hypothetical protein METESE_32070 [Mesoterricola sediminis]
MNLKNLCLPALAGLALLVGCDSKPADSVPKTAPMAAKEAHALLPHLKYIGVRKDLQDVAVIAPQDLAGLYGNAWWFHKHAGSMDLSLTAEEIKALGADEIKAMGYIAPGVSMASLQAAMDKLSAKQIPALPAEMQGLDVLKLDQVPTDEKDKTKAKDFAALNGPQLRALYNTGLYRLIKGVPEALWGEIAVMKSTPNPKNTQETALLLGLQGKPIMELTARQKADGTQSIIYIHYLVQPKVLAKAAAQMAEKK